MMAASWESQAQNAQAIGMEFSFYPYQSEVKEDYDFTLNTTIALPGKFSYFSFANFKNILSSGSPDLTNSEHNLRWQVADLPIDLAAQLVILDGPGNDNLQIGPRWRLSDTPLLRSIFRFLHLSHSATFFFQRYDSVADEVKQISHAYSMSFPYISDRLYLSGFVDHNFHKRPPSGGRKRGVMTETQIGLRIHKQIYAIAEYRLNQYRRGEKSNISLGLELKTGW